MADGPKTESQRVLDRINAEDGGFLGRSSQRLEKHLSAADAPQQDRIEVWGTRIGRGIALVVTLVVIAWALAWLFSG